jgi:NAD(P)-dependent dehydrogenase (short-subunit alcohol dehydrogenase family)
MSVEQKVAVVTGASRGLGEGIANAFRDQGYRVVGTSRSIEPSDDPDYLTVAGDIGDPATGKKVIEEALSRFGRVDTLVNNAGIFIPNEFTKYTSRQFEDLLSTNLNGFFYITQQAVGAMVRQGSGHVVQITTTIVEHANSAVPSVLASLTKGGLTAATRSLAIEYASRNIRVNAVAPGMIKTPMHAPASLTALASLHPLNRMGEIADIVQAILYLEEASFVTGEILHVDGGQIAGH